jgi:hypothetical protein
VAGGGGYTQNREGKSRDSENFSALSAGAYTTTGEGYIESTCCCVQARFLGMENKKTLFLVKVYSVLFHNVCKALNLF